MQLLGSSSSSNLRSCKDQNKVLTQIVDVPRMCQNPSSQETSRFKISRKKSKNPLQTTTEGLVNTKWTGKKTSKHANKKGEQRFKLSDVTTRLIQSKVCNLREWEHWISLHDIFSLTYDLLIWTDSKCSIKESCKKDTPVHS